MNWVYWWLNQSLDESLDYAAPVEVEASYYQSQAATPART